MDNSQAKTVDDFRAQQARQDAVDRLQAAVNHLQRSTYELEIYIEQIKSAQEDKQRSDVMSWAISSITCNIMPNLRVEMLARSQADLAVAVASKDQL